MEHPFWPSELAPFVEEIAPDLENRQDLDVDTLELCDQCGADLEDGACPYCLPDWPDGVPGAS